MWCISLSIYLSRLELCACELVRVILQLLSGNISLDKQEQHHYHYHKHGIITATSTQSTLASLSSGLKAPKEQCFIAVSMLLIVLFYGTLESVTFSVVEIEREGGRGRESERALKGRCRCKCGLWFGFGFESRCELQRLESVSLNSVLTASSMAPKKPKRMIAITNFEMNEASHHIRCCYYESWSWW